MGEPAEKIRQLSNQELGHDFIDSLRIRRLSPKTIVTYRSMINDLVGYLDREGLTPAQVDYRMAERWLLILTKRSYAGSTTQGHVSVARSFWKWMGKYDYVSINPWRELDTVKYKAPLPKPLPEGEIRDLIDKEPEPFWRMFWHFLYGTGARISEATGIQRKHLDFGAKRVCIYGKGSKERFVPVTDKFIELMSMHLLSLRDEPNCYVFPGKGGKKIRSKTVARYLKMAAERINIKSNVTPHRFRHSIATHLLEHGADIRLVQEFLGHDLLSTTQKYTKVAQNQLVQMVDRFHPNL